MNKTIYPLVFVFALTMTLIVGGCGESSSETEGAVDDQSAQRNEHTQNESNEEVSPDFPEEDIEFIVPTTPGGGFDVLVRQFIPYWEDHLPNDLSVYVENRPGGNWNIGLGEVFNAEPDGYTVGIINVPGNVVNQLFDEANYDLAEFEYIGRLSDDIYVTAVSTQSGITSLEELQERAIDEDILIGNDGLATSGGLGTVLATEEFGLDNLNFVPHEGASEAILSALRGEVDYVQYPYGTLLPHIDDAEDEDDALVPITVFADERVEGLPDVPTVDELGYEGLSDTVAIHRLIVAPPGTPDDVLNVLRDTFMDAVAEPELAETIKENDGRMFNPADHEEARELSINALSEYEQFKDLIDEYR